LHARHDAGELKVIREERTHGCGRLMTASSTSSQRPISTSSTACSCIELRRGVCPRQDIPEEEDRGIPILALDVEYGDGPSGQLTTRFEAFPEMLQNRMQEPVASH
jgi:hypothetical protein